MHQNRQESAAVSDHIEPLRSDILTFSNDKSISNFQFADDTALLARGPRRRERSFGVGDRLSFELRGELKDADQLSED